MSWGAPILRGFNLVTREKESTLWWGAVGWGTFTVPPTRGV